MFSPPHCWDAKADQKCLPTNSGTVQTCIDTLIAFNSVTVKKKCLIAMGMGLKILEMDRDKTMLEKRQKNTGAVQSMVCCYLEVKNT